MQLGVLSISQRRKVCTLIEVSLGIAVYLNAYETVHRQMDTSNLSL